VSKAVLSLRHHVQFIASHLLPLRLFAAMELLYRARYSVSTENGTE